MTRWIKLFFCVKGLFYFRSKRFNQSYGLKIRTTFWGYFCGSLKPQFSYFLFVRQLFTLPSSRLAPGTWRWLRQSWLSAASGLRQSWPKRSNSRSYVQFYLTFMLKLNGVLSKMWLLRPGTCNNNIFYLFVKSNLVKLETVFPPMVSIPWMDMGSRSSLWCETDHGAAL